jgi:hypothetical protein
LRLLIQEEMVTCGVQVVLHVIGDIAGPITNFGERWRGPFTSKAPTDSTYRAFPSSLASSIHYIYKAFVRHLQVHLQTQSTIFCKTFVNLIAVTWTSKPNTNAFLLRLCQDLILQKKHPLLVMLPPYVQRHE